MGLDGLLEPFSPDSKRRPQEFLRIRIGLWLALWRLSEPFGVVGLGVWGLGQFRGWGLGQFRGLGFRVYGSSGV